MTPATWWHDSQSIAWQQYVFSKCWAETQNCFTMSCNAETVVTKNTANMSKKANLETREPNGWPGQ